MDSGNEARCISGFLVNTAIRIKEAHYVVCILWQKMSFHGQE